MSEIKISEIEKLSRLSRIAVSSEQKETLAKQVDQVIDWVNNLSELHTDDIEPMNIPNLSHQNQNLSNLRLEDDLVSEGGISDEVLKNAPKSIYGYFAVPKVIE